MTKITEPVNLLETADMERSKKSSQQLMMQNLIQPI